MDLDKLLDLFWIEGVGRVISLTVVVADLWKKVRT
jgi:hypothetical protein